MVESGWFYGTFVDPVLTPMRKRVAKYIHPGEKVIDIACGTGAQVFEFAQKASEAVGVDLSESMIRKAVKTKSTKNIKNTAFFVSDATQLKRFTGNNFDAATMSLALHQFEPEQHVTILEEMKNISKRIIIVDYAVPLPKNVAGYGSQIAEFFAGVEHHHNFKSYCRLGGLEKILPESNLKIEHSEFFGNNAFQLVVCSA